MLGKAVGALQQGITVDGTSISGTLKYVTDLTEFSGETELQSGNYIALSVTSVPDAVITGEIVGGASGPVAIEDGVIVFRITSPSQKIRFVAVTADGMSKQVVYNLSGVTLEVNS